MAVPCEPFARKIGENRSLILLRGSQRISCFPCRPKRSTPNAPVSVCVLPRRRSLRVDEPLSSEEVQTLRRIANSGGYISTLREQDVARLLALKLIYGEGTKVHLTARGRDRVFSGGL